MSLHQRVSLIVAIGLLVCVLMPACSLAADLVDMQKATRIKAAYLYHLARLSEWPDESFSGTTDTLYICIVGEDLYDLSGFLNAEAPGLLIDQHPVSIKHLPDTTKLLEQCRSSNSVPDPCHILFFAASELNNFQSYLELVPDRHVMTTSEIDTFPQHGGMVGFVVDGGRVRIKVNPHAVSNASLKISAEFLQHADIIEKFVDPKRGG